jgi:hypothetical protein
MNPLEDLEAILLNPPATGLCAVRVPESSAAAKAGLKQGDIILSVNGKSFKDRAEYYAAVRPGDAGPVEHTFEVQRAVGDVETLKFHGWPIAFKHCFVRKAEPAWTHVPDTEYEPDFSGLQGEIWLKNSFGEEPAGFESLMFAVRGDMLEVKTLFRLGGEGEQAWDYRTRGESLHRLQSGLPVTETAFWEGAPDKEKLKGEVKLQDGNWVGRHGNAEGEVREVSFAEEAPVCTAYTTTLLPLTMPLREGASLTFFLTHDGIGHAVERGRIECVGRRKTTVLGKEVEAWCFAWRHYGVGRDEDDEKFWVSDDRKLVRIDWGPDYGGCWCELVEGKEALGKLPVKVE